MNIKDYISLARPSHWLKNIFMLPGVAFAFLLTKTQIDDFLLPLILGVVSACLISSANYVINEWFDAKYDYFHPLKKSRAAVSGKIKFLYLYFEYFLLGLAGILIATQISGPFFIISFVFLTMGVIYNIRPFRTKEIVYLDVLTESINNPIRLLLGWFVVTSDPLPPSSLILGYWLAGAFLMGIKRYAEYRFIGDPKVAALYRNSFKYYTEENLLISSFFYSMCAAFFLGVFLIKYHTELFLSLPLFAILFAWYLKLGMEKNSPVQFPEKLFQNKLLTMFIIFLSIVVTVLLLVDFPLFDWLLNNAFLIQNG